MSSFDRIFDGKLFIKQTTHRNMSVRINISESAGTCGIIEERHFPFTAKEAVKK
jgi:hypothetical protein